MQLRKIRAYGLIPFPTEERTIDLEALGPDDRIVAVTGRNGAGKSTILECWPGAMYRECPTRGPLTKLAAARNAFVEVEVLGADGAAWTLRQSVDAVSGKGTALVLDAQGRSVLPSDKVSAFDKWAPSRVPQPDVFFASQFAAQGSGGLVAMQKAGDRKAVILRAYGVERLEGLAERARERKRQASGTAEGLRARIADATERTGDPEELARDLEEAKRADADARAILDDVRATLEDTRKAERAHEEAQAERARILSRHNEAEVRIAALEAQIADAEKRIANNRRLTERREEIEHAVERAESLRAELAEAQASARQATSSLDDAQRARREAAQALEEAEARARSLEDSLRDRQAIEDAAESIPALEAAEAAVREALTEAEERVEVLGSKRFASVEERVHGLREGLREIRDVDETISQAKATARDRLSEDDDAVRLVDELPRQLAAAEETLRQARAASREAADKLAKARSTASGLSLVQKAAERLEGAQAEAARAAERLEEHRRRVEALKGEATAKLGEATEARRALDDLADVVKLARPLADASARIDELDRQIIAARASLDAEREALAAAPEPPEVPPKPGPGVAAVSSDAEIAERAARRSAEDVARLAQKVEAAAAVAEQVEWLRAELATAERDLADWTLLADSLGRDGLQALEVDAAGPELSQVANDLLHSCFGSRFTLRIDTTRTASDGKRQIEDCEVMVIDTERGTESPARTKSGGEGVILGEAVSLALTVAACRRSGVERPTLVRDESGAALDAQNGKAYVAMLRRAADMVGADRVLFVSHSPALWDLADARIDLGQIDAPNEETSAEAAE